MPRCCVRLPAGFARQIFSLTKLGLRVVISRDDIAPVAIAPAIPTALLALLCVPLARRPIEQVRRGVVGPELVPVLAGTGTLQLAYGVLLGIGLAFG